MALIDIGPSKKFGNKPLAASSNKADDIF